MDKHKGGCLCGKLRYTTTGAPARVVVCHCTWCQRRTGSSFAVEAPFEIDNVEIVGDFTLHRSTSDESGRWLDRHFCPKCGCCIGFTLEWRPDAFLIDVGTYDDPHWIKAQGHDCKFIYLSSAQVWSKPPDWADTYDRHYR